MGSSKTGNAVFYSVLLALQFGLQPLLANWLEHSSPLHDLFLSLRSLHLLRFTHPSINKSLIVISTEITKIFIAFLSLLLFHSREELRVIVKGWDLTESLQVAAFPAILYAIQNILIQHGFLSLNSLTFNLLNQTKVRLSLHTLDLDLDYSPRLCLLPCGCSS
jgi:hypothetical protein